MRPIVGLENLLALTEGRIRGLNAFIESGAFSPRSVSNPTSKLEQTNFGFFPPMIMTSGDRDRLYVLFLTSFIPTILCTPAIITLAIITDLHPTVFDAIPLYPKSLVPKPLLATHQWYKAYFNDQIMITQPPWFRFFCFLELVYQLPVAAWGVWALATKSPKSPAHLLVWAIVCAGTTFTTLVEFYHNPNMTDQEKATLIALYGFYGVICGFSSHFY